MTKLGAANPHSNNQPRAAIFTAQQSEPAAATSYVALLRAIRKTGLAVLLASIAPLTATLAAAAPAAKTPAALSSPQSQTIVLGAGCFWGVEKRYQALPGVLEAVSGYAGGKGVAPTYQAITAPNRRLDQTTTPKWCR